MEETKTHKAKSSDVGECQNSCLNMHRYCYTGCCLLRTVLTVLLVVIIFGIGYCSGFSEGREMDSRHDNYRGHMMHHDRDVDYLFERSYAPGQPSGIPVMRVMETTMMEGGTAVMPTAE